MDYSKKTYSFLKLKGKIWESEYRHFVVGREVLKKLTKKGKVLDIGCGAGGLTSLWKKRFDNLSFTGIDLSASSISLAKKRYKNIKFLIHDANALEKIKGKFDLISACEVIEHLNNPSAFVKKIHHKLEKNGYLYLTTQLEKDPTNIFGLFSILTTVNLKRIPAGHIQTFDRKILFKTLRQAHFEILDVFYNTHLFGQVEDFIYSLYLNLTKKEYLSFSKELDQKHKIYKYLGYLVMRTISIIKNIEDYLLSEIPGLGIQIVARRK